MWKTGKKQSKSKSESWVLIDSGFFCIFVLYKPTNNKIMNVPFTPMRGRLLVQSIISKEQKTASGIIVPATESPDNKAKVIKVGEGMESIIGKTISYRDDAGRLVRIQGKEYLLLFENDIDGFYE